MLEILYLGHVISHEGVRVDEQKIFAIQDWSIPTTLMQLRGFLGYATITGDLFRVFLTWWNLSHSSPRRMPSFGVMRHKRLSGSSKKSCAHVPVWPYPTFQPHSQWSVMHPNWV